MNKLLLSAVVAASSVAMSAYADEWRPVTNVADLVDGTECLVVCRSKGKAMSTAQAATYRGAVDVDIQNNCITEVPADAAVVRVSRSGDLYNLYVTNGDSKGYLQPISDGKKTLNVADTPVDAKISISNGQVSVEFTNYDGKNMLDYYDMYDFSLGATVPVFYCQDVPFNDLYLYSNTVGGTPDVAWSFSPAEGNYVETLEQLTLSFENVASVAVTENAEPLELTATLRDDAVEAPAVTINGTVVTFSYASALSTAGVYHLDIPEGYFTFGLADGNTKLSDAISYDLYIEGRYIEQSYTVSPEPGAYDEFPVITLTYDNCTGIELTGDPQAYLTISDGEDLSEEYVLGITVKDNVVTLTPNEKITTYAENAYYTVFVFAETYNLTINGTTVANEEIELSDFTIKQNSGVATVAAARGNELFDVYTPTGVCVARKAASLSGLAKGIYIVNGKKIAVR